MAGNDAVSGRNESESMISGVYVVCPMHIGTQWRQTGSSKFTSYKCELSQIFETSIVYQESSEKIYCGGMKAFRHRAG